MYSNARSGMDFKGVLLGVTLLHFRVDATMAVIVKDADMPQSAPTSLLLDQHAGFITK